jgi:hypothetical protein
LWVRPQYSVEEHFRRYETLEEVVSAEGAYPLQQFYVIPCRWDYWVQHRREVPDSPGWSAPLYQVYFFIVMEVGLHLAVLFLTRLFRFRGATHFFFRRILPLTVLRGWKVTGKSQDMLVMEHELFRHVEIELFVKRDQLDDSIQFVRELVSHFDGERDAMSPATVEQLKQLGLFEPADIGTYTHCYPICIRRILPDDTLISMASGDDQDCYSLSFNCYTRPSELQAFNRFCEVLTRAMASLFKARPHWGKIFPMDAASVKSLYPKLTEFQRVCTEFDPEARFRNQWVSRLLFAE